MLYLIAIDYTSKHKICTLFETHTESSITEYEGYFMKLIKENKIEIINAHINNEGLKIKTWPNTIWQSNCQMGGKNLNMRY